MKQISCASEQAGCGKIRYVGERACRFYIVDFGETANSAARSPQRGCGRSGSAFPVLMDGRVRKSELIYWRLTMPIEHEMAEPLAGYHFFLHQDDPSHGILRLDTSNDQRWLRPESLSALAAPSDRSLR